VWSQLLYAKSIFPSEKESSFNSREILSQLQKSHNSAFLNHLIYTERRTFEAMAFDIADALGYIFKDFLPTKP